MNIQSTTWFQYTCKWVGGLPARRVSWILVLCFSIWIPLDVFVLKLTGNLSNSSFDAMVRARVLVAEPDPRIVIIDIDEATLARMSKEFGRWPWPRDTLATLMNFIESQQPAAIVWDILFSDPDKTSPGGDAAFDEGARKSLHSHFSIVRLPSVNDIESLIDQTKLPGLWVSDVQFKGQQGKEKSSNVAMIPPALPSIANGRLGYNNGYADSDGILRRYRHFELLNDGTAIQSISSSVLAVLEPAAYREQLSKSTTSSIPNGELILWRRHIDAYPRISLSDVFTQAEGGKNQIQLPSFSGKVVIIGATAPSLHDIHPTPLSNMQPGVEVLATVIDNSLNKRHLLEIPRWLQAVLAITICIVLAMRVQFKSAGSLHPYLLALPFALLFSSYLSINILPIFLDLHLAAGLALIFLTVLSYWSKLRRIHWCTLAPQNSQYLAIWPLELKEPLLDGVLDHFIDALERNAPSCRLVVSDAKADWPFALRWPELACFAAIVGPHNDLLTARANLELDFSDLLKGHGEPILIDANHSREQVLKNVFRAWTDLQNTETIKI